MQKYQTETVYTDTSLWVLLILKMCTQLLPQTQWMCLGEQCTVFSGLVCVCVRIYEYTYNHLNDTNKMIRTLCSNYTNTCSQIDDSTGFVRIEKFYLEITLSFGHTRTHVVCSQTSFWVCVFCFDGQKWFTYCLTPFCLHILPSMSNFRARLGERMLCHFIIYFVPFLVLAFSIKTTTNRKISITIKCG